MKENKNREGLRSMTETALAVALICLCSWISLPIGAVPITMQLFGIYFALYYLRGVRGFCAVLCYIFLGALGLPVFSGFGGGVGRLLDGSGGFILGFAAAAAVHLLFSLLPRRWWGDIVATVMSLSVIYIIGALWYSVVYLGGVGSIGAAIVVTVLPFVALDVAKIALAAFLCRRVRSAMHRGRA